jgi:hypothetical protein
MSRTPDGHGFSLGYHQRKKVKEVEIDELIGQGAGWAPEPV